MTPRKSRPRTANLRNSNLRTTNLRTPWQRYGWLMSAIWLGFMYYPIQAMLTLPAPQWAEVLGWVGIAVFPVCYLTGFIHGMRGEWHRPDRLVWAMFACSIVAVLLTTPAIDWNAVSFLPFLLSYASYLLGKVWHWVTVSVSLVLVAIPTWAVFFVGGEAPWVLLGVIVIMSVMNTLMIYLISSSVSTENVRFELASSEERESIARDVHDLIGHSLTVVKLKAELASRLVDTDPEREKAELGEIAQLAGDAISGVRSTVTGLRAASLPEQLVASRQVLEAEGVSVSVSGDELALSPAQSLPCSWILREATTNILRHAQASHVEITFAPGTMSVADDGSGMRGESGNGLRGMAERASAAGASVVLESALGVGTKVTVTW